MSENGERCGRGVGEDDAGDVPRQISRARELFHSKKSQGDQSEDAKEMLLTLGTAVKRSGKKGDE